METGAPILTKSFVPLCYFLSCLMNFVPTLLLYFFCLNILHPIYKVKPCCSLFVNFFFCILKFPKVYLHSDVMFTYIMLFARQRDMNSNFIGSCLQTSVKAYKYKMEHLNMFSSLSRKRRENALRYKIFLFMSVRFSLGDLRARFEKFPFE